MCAKEAVIKTDLELLQRLPYKQMTISQIARELGKSLSWTSERVSHLKKLGLIDVEKKGLSNFVAISSNPVGKSLSLLMTESSYLNLNKILTGSGLLMLPLLLEPGSQPKDISTKVSRSLRTVKDALVRWNSMGVVILDGNTGLYSLNQKQNYLIEFVKAYSEFRNKRLLEEIFPEAIMVWQWRDDFLFSTPHQIAHPKFVAAAVSRLDQFGCKIVHTSHYYFYSPNVDTVSEEEAFSQAMKIHPGNPRISRLVKDALKDGTIKKAVLRHYAKKYDIVAIIDQKQKNNEG